MRTAEAREPTVPLVLPDTKIRKIQTFAGLMLVVGLVLSGIGIFVDLGWFPNDHVGFWHSYLFAYLFWAGVTVGSLAALMLHHVVGGRWGFVIRRLLEEAAGLWWLAAVLFLPVFIGLRFFDLYHWVHPNPSDPVLAEKSAWLNVPFFLIRTVIYFAIWGALATLMRKWGATQYQRTDLKIAGNLNRWGAFGLVVYCLTVTFAGVDWVMSLVPHWYSSIYGMLTVASQGLSTIALMLVLLYWVGHDQPLLGEAPEGSFRDLGNLMLALVMLWAYMSFSQYLIIYSGNITEEATWYVQRNRNGWAVISAALMVLHFGLPFLILILGSNVKRNPRRLMWVALFIVCMRFVDLYWWVTPTFRSHLSLGIADLGTPLLIGGFWLLVWAGMLKGKPLVPLYDPRLVGHWPEKAHHHG